MVGIADQNTWSRNMAIPCVGVLGPPTKSNGPSAFDSAWDYCYPTRDSVCIFLRLQRPLTWVWSWPSCWMQRHWYQRLFGSNLEDVVAPVPEDAVATTLWCGGHHWGCNGPLYLIKCKPRPGLSCTVFLLLGPDTNISAWQLRQTIQWKFAWWYVFNHLFRF
jgi:hypothetical protein